MVNKSIDEIKEIIFERFSDLKFDPEPHKYYVGETPIRESMTKIVERYQYPVDWDAVAQAVAQVKNIDVKDLREEWKQAKKEGASIGTETHDFGENYVKSNFSLTPKTGLQRAIVNFWRDLPDFLKIVGLEVKMYHEEFMIAGTMDILLYNPETGKFIILDYKTNKDIFKNYRNQKMLPPFHNLLCSPFGHFSVQLSGYQMMAEQIEDLKVGHRKIIWLKDDGSYYLYDVEDFSLFLYNDLKKMKYGFG